MITCRIRVLARRRVGELGRQHNIFAMPLCEFTERSFTRAVGVEIGGIEEISADVAKRVVNLPALFLRATPAPVFPEGHCSKAHL
jgi:hypothetical protein